MHCIECGKPLAHGAECCPACGAQAQDGGQAASFPGGDAGIASFDIRASTIAGEFEYVRYEKDMLVYACGGRLTPPVQRSASFFGRGFDALCGYIRDSHIESWPTWDPTFPKPVGRIFPRIEIVFKDGGSLLWEDRQAPASACWTLAENEISYALGLEFRLAGRAYGPTPAPTHDPDRMNWPTNLLALRALQSPYVLERVRALRILDERYLDRLCQDGLDDIPGCVVEAVYKTLRMYPGASDDLLQFHMLSDKALMTRLVQDLELACRAPEKEASMRAFKRML